MVDGGEAPSLLALWEQSVENDPDAPFIHVTTLQDSRVQKYTFATFFKRAQRHAVALQSVLGVGPGDKVALCVDDLSAFALLVHGALLVGAVVIPVEGFSTITESVDGFVEQIVSGISRGDRHRVQHNAMVWQGDVNRMRGQEIGCGDCSGQERLIVFEEHG